MCRYPGLFKKEFCCEDELRRFVMSYAWYLNKYEKIPMNEAIKDGWECARMYARVRKHRII